MKKTLNFAALAIAFVVLITGCRKDDFVEIDAVCPIVVSTSPANNETNVPLVKTITATFNEVMNPATITQASFTIMGGAAVAGTITYAGQTASFAPSAVLRSNTTYVGKISTAVKDPSGNALQTAYTWTFSTGATVAPIVISTDPANATSGLALNKIVTATFNMNMDPASLNATTFTLKNGTTPVAGTVSLTDTTAYFTPAANLLTNSTYTATITTGAKNLAGIALASNYVWTFTTGLVTAPTVISNTPLTMAVGVPVATNATATFSEPMDPLTINSLTFTLRHGATPVPGAVTYSGSTATFTPSSHLLSGIFYTATITTGAKNPFGVALANNHNWTFTTLALPGPTVISTDPLDGEIGVALNKVVSATFSEPMNQATLNGSTFTLKQGNSIVAGAVSRSSTTASFTPFSNLMSGTTYTATITTGATNVAGAALANNYVWTFTTISIPPPTIISTDPVNLATNVPLNKVIRVTFSEIMDPLTINNGTFTLKQGSTVISGAVNSSGTQASFTPNTDLLSDTTYTATITTGVRSLAGVSLVSNYVWTFSTVQHLGPPPVDLGTVARFGIIAGVGVSNNAGFSEIHDMDVGISPGVRSSITGFPPAIVVNGAIYASDDVAPPGVAAMLTQAKNDLTAAYLFAEAQTLPAPATVSGDLGGLTLAPGIYKTNSTLLIQSGDLTLDAQGDVNAVWIFQIASGFTTVGGAGGNVILSGGAQAANVFWQTGTSATIGDYTSFKGTILALTSITMNSYAVATGRMLCRNAAVVLTHTNMIYKP